MSISFQSEFLDFINTKQRYQFRKWLTPGGTGKTVLMHDDSIDLDFVCKKFVPTQKKFEDKCFQNFVEEIKILYCTYHKNIVRLFNHYIFESVKTGFIIMEYIPGEDIKDFLTANPQNINDVFIQCIEGFLHLESINILHRDIRASNFIVSNKDNTVKIIDFGYGKILENDSDDTTSLHLNWTYGAEPLEIHDRRYTVATDVYFLGRLFEKIIDETSNSYFEFSNIINKMTQLSPENRFSSFSDIKKAINKQTEISISDDDKQKYNYLANSLVQSIASLLSKPKFDFDDESVLRKLNDVLIKSAWEAEIRNIESFVNCFFESIDCKYETTEIDDFGNYEGEFTINISKLTSFTTMFMRLNKESRNNLLNNLYYNRISNISIDAGDTKNDFFSVMNDEDLPF